MSLFEWSYINYSVSLLANLARRDYSPFIINADRIGLFMYIWLMKFPRIFWSKRRLSHVESPQDMTEVGAIRVQTHFRISKYAVNTGFFDTPYPEKSSTTFH